MGVPALQITRTAASQNGEQLPAVVEEVVGEIAITESAIADVLKQSTLDLGATLQEVNEMIRQCEAEVDVTEQVTVTKKMIRVDRRIHIAKDRP